ncbi:MAG: BatA domain-containing protein [Planctomycetota bacterium]|nr:BatA domain-containing protein [Planctomycetota bacterium]
MSFWHAAFLAGTATFVIPIIIHLVFRMRKRRLVFSSLRFLQQSLLKESRRLRLRDLILLLLRCAACILIALSFARPFRPASVLAGAVGRPQEDVVLVLDDSPSLLAQEGASVRWPSLLERVRKEVSRHVPGDHVALVLASDPGRAEIELSGNFGAITAALQRDKPSSRRGDLAQALNTGIELLSSSQQLVRRLVLYSDVQANQVDRGAWAEIAQKAAAAGRGIGVEIETPSGTQPARLPNVSVVDVRPKTDVWIEGRPVSFAVRVANHGDGEHPSLLVKLVVDGKVLATRTVGLGPRSSTEVELSTPLPRAGELCGHVEIEAHDAFPDDDKRLFAVHLRDSLRVLVIEERLAEKDSFLSSSASRRSRIRNWPCSKTPFAMAATSCCSRGVPMGACPKPSTTGRSGKAARGSCPLGLARCTRATVLKASTISLVSSRRITRSSSLLSEPTSRTCAWRAMSAISRPAPPT